MLHANYAILILLVLFCASILYCILKAGRGREIYVRPIAGLEAIDEAVGRATEMGRPVFFTPGLSGLDITGLCAVAILKRVARLAARFHNRVIVVVNRFLLYPLCEEACREAYSAEGRGDLFSSDDVVLIVGQFPYAAGCVGLMHRERVAATFLFGSFAAESLILAEGGHQAGAIQVAGTDSNLQIPFFVAACDFTIIGEEYYAATAYLTKDPTMLGSLRGQDLGKGLIFLLLVVGVLVGTWVALEGSLSFNGLAELLEK
jgi:hypothetical protein